MIAKLLSGRFLFTVISAMVFAQMSISGKITGEQALIIINAVVIFYFTKQQNGGVK